MRLPRRLSASVFVSTLIAAGLAGCSSNDAKDTTDVVIGADLSSTSATDTAYGRALQLEVEQINASGRLGNKRLVLRIADNRSDTTASMRDIGSFADDPSVVAVVTGDCAECIGYARKPINEKQVPTIALVSSDLSRIEAASQRWIFKLGPNSTDDSAAMTSELQSAKIRKIAVLHADDLGSQDAFNALTGGSGSPNLTKAGLTMTGDQTVKSTSSDVTQAMNALVATDPDAILVLTEPDLATTAAIAVRAAKFKGRLFFDAGAAGDLFIPREATAAMENANMIFTQTLVIDDVVATTPAKAARKQWFRDYTSRYGSYNGRAAFAADAVSLIADGVALGGLNRGAIRDVLETSQVDALAGPIRLTPDNHSGLMPQALTLLVARSGRWRLASGTDDGLQ